MSPWLYIFCCYLKMVSQDLQPLAPSNPRDYNKFNILLVKVFSLKQKTNQILPATIEKKKTNFVSLAFRIFWHIQKYSGTF